MCVPTSIGHSNSVGRGKNNFLLDDLLQMINDTMFDNIFANQHRFDYSEPNKYVLIWSSYIAQIG